MPYPIKITLTLSLALVSVFFLNLAKIMNTHIIRIYLLYNSCSDLLEQLNEELAIRNLEEETNSLAILSISRERFRITTLTSVMGPTGELLGFVLPLTTPPENIHKLDYTLHPVHNNSTPQQQPANLLESVIPHVADYQYRVKGLLTVADSSVLNLMSHQNIVPIVAIESTRLTMNKPAWEIIRKFSLSPFQGAVHCHPYLPDDSPHPQPRAIKNGNNIYVRTNYFYCYGVVLIDLVHISSTLIGGETCNHQTAISSFVQPGSNPEQHYQTGELSFIGSCEPSTTGCMLHGQVTFRSNMSSSIDLQNLLHQDSMYLISPVTEEGYRTYNHLTYVMDTDAFRRIYTRQQLLNILKTTANYPHEVAEEKFQTIALDVRTIFRTDVFHLAILITPGYHRGESVLQAYELTPSSLTTLCLQNKLQQATIL